MLIGVNENHEIKQIDQVTDETLLVIDVGEREKVFNDMSDLRILRYCYKKEDYGYAIYPAILYSDIEKLEKDEEILTLQAHVIELEFEKRIGEVM